MEVWAVVVAAGSGSRFGRAKQYEPLGGMRVLDHAVGAVRPVCVGVVLVVGADRVRAEAEGPSGADRVVAGGVTRSASVRAGLDAVPTTAEVIVVHDGVRPLASDELVRRVVSSVVDGADAAVPAMPVTDTLRRVDGGIVDRDRLVAVQTPQAFRAVALREAHRAGGEATDDSALVEACGGTVVLVPGERRNLKVTEPIDLLTATALLGS